MKNLYELSGIKGEDVFKSTAEHPFTIRKDSSSMYAPISFDGVTAQWGIGSATNYDVFTAVARHMIYILVAVGIIGILLLLAALISFVTKRISTPMSDLQGVVENFARLDLRADNPAYVRARGYLGREDEIGAMTGDLAELANNLRATMGKINASSESVAATSEELTATTQTTAHSSEAVEETGEVVKKLNASAKTMGEKHASISDVVQNLSALAEENAATTEEGSASVETQSNALEDIAKASEGLAEIATDLQREVECFKL